jgi:hypothetical protein
VERPPVAREDRVRPHARTGEGDGLGAIRDARAAVLYVAPWLTVSLVPVIPGSRGVGSEALQAEGQFLASWRERYGCDQTSLFSSWPPRIVPGIRRAIITEMQEW